MNALPIIVATGIACLIWRVVHNLFIRSPLDNIPGPAPPSLIRGNLGQLFDRHGWDFLDGLGEKYGKVVRLTGILGHRILYVFDPAALHQVIIKEADIYDLPEWSTDNVRLTMGPGLLGVHGNQHRRQRRMLNPVFSIKHMRSITPVFYDVAHKLRSGLEVQVGDKPTTVDILGWFGRTALELIGQGGLGYSLDTLDTPAPNPYGDALKEFLPALFANSELQFLTNYVKKIGSPAFRAAMIDWLPLPALHRVKRIVNKMDTEAKNVYFHKRNAFQAGEQSVLKQVEEGKDIMSVLLQANMAASEENRLTDEEIIGQMSLLVIAGTDTTSNSLTVVMELLAQYPDIQDKLRAEIKQAREECGEDIPYDTLVSLPYMDALCRETLRLFPPVSFIFREAQKDIVMPLSEPMISVDRTTINEIPVPAGTTVIVAIRPVNQSKDIWGDDAKEFKPERWLSPLPSTVMDAHVPGVYSNLMTFNGGGRACIGFKFSQLEMKVVLATIISTFKVSLAPNAKDVMWNLSAVRYPTVGNDSDRPACPITLECLKV